MDCGFERWSEKVLICLLSAFVAVSLLFCTTAEADIYDDFTNGSIDTGKWTISDPDHLFSQPGDGQLYFQSDNSNAVQPPPGGSLRSTTSFSAAFFSMDFNSFFSSNTSPGGQGLGSFAALGLGTKTTKYARMLRGQVVGESGAYFEANYYDGALLHVWYVLTDVTSGQLGLSYDGSMVSFFYNDGQGWKGLDTSGPDTNGQTVTVTPGWILPPPLFISGTPGGSGLTGFAVDKVEYTPVPEPSTMILLGSGLIGLAGLRNKFKR